MEHPSHRSNQKIDWANPILAPQLDKEPQRIGQNRSVRTFLVPMENISKVGELCS
jgi:hypothetical protein